MSLWWRCQMMMIIPNLSERKRVLCDDDVVHHVDHPVGGHLVMLIIVIIMTMMLMVITLFSMVGTISPWWPNWPWGWSASIEKTLSENMSLTPSTVTWSLPSLSILTWVWSFDSGMLYCHFDFLIFNLFPSSPRCDHLIRGCCIVII